MAWKILTVKLKGKKVGTDGKCFWKGSIGNVIKQYPNGDVTVTIDNSPIKLRRAEYDVMNRERLNG